MINPKLCNTIDRERNNKNINKTHPTNQFEVIQLNKVITGSNCKMFESNVVFVTQFKNRCNEKLD